MEGRNFLVDGNGRLFLSLTILLVIVAFPLGSSAQMHIGGVVEGTLFAWQSPLVVDNTLIILAGTTLLIEPSVEIVFDKNDSIRVYGNLTAIGNAQDSVFFIKSDTADTEWYGMIFEDPYASNSVLQYCSVKGSTHGLTFDSCSPEVANSLISSSRSGIYVQYSVPAITNNSINISIEEGSPYIAYGIQLWDSPCSIEYNTINVENPNIQLDVNAFGVHASLSQLRLLRNYINVYSKGKPVGVFHYGSSKDTVSYNEIVVHSEGSYVRAGLMQVDCSTAFITNNTIVVSSPYKDISMQFMQYSFGMKIINNIICGDFNSKGIEFLDYSIPEELTYNDLFGHSEILVGYSPLDPSNIIEDPLFTMIMPDSMYYLTSHSPCINAGHPASMFFDPDSTIGDMGAHYFEIQVEAPVYEPPAQFDLIQVYPNPTNSSSIIKLDLNETSDVDIEAFDILGRSAVILFQGQLPPSRHYFNWDMSNLSNGIYFIRISIQDNIQVEKIILLK